MSVPFTLAQEDRIAEIVRGIFTDVLQGADARIRDAIDTLLGEETIRNLARDEFARCTHAHRAYTAAASAAIEVHRRGGPVVVTVADEYGDVCCSR